MLGAGNHSGECKTTLFIVVLVSSLHVSAAGTSHEAPEFEESHRTVPVLMMQTPSLTIGDALEIRGNSLEPKDGCC